MTQTDCYVGVNLDLDLKNPDKCENVRALCTLWILISVKIQILKSKVAKKLWKQAKSKVFFQLWISISGFKTLAQYHSLAPPTHCKSELTAMKCCR